MTREELYENLKYLIESGQIVIRAIRINDGVQIIDYTTLSACPPAHQVGYHRAFTSCRDVYIQDVAYLPVLATASRAQSIASLE